MSFFDSVKEEVREEHQPDDGTAADGEEGDGDVPFDKLKKDAEEQDEDTEQNTEAGTADTGDDIEVLRSDDGGASRADTDAGTDTSRTASSDAGETAQTPTPSQPEDVDTGGAATSAGDASAPTPDARDAESEVARDEVVQSLKRIEEQNDAMLDVLRGIKRSLDS